MSKLQLSVAAICLALAGAAFAQQKTVNVGQVYVMVPKPGMSKQFEEGRKRHMEFHRKQNDTWSWEAYEIMTGDNTGNYLSVTFGHTWKDLDAWEEKMGQADTADSNANLMPYLGTTQESIWSVMTDVSRPAAEPTSKMIEIDHYMLKPGSEEEFEYTLGKVNDAIGKTNWPVHYTFYQLMNGGEGPHYVLVIPHGNWADMAEPEMSFNAMLEKAVGRHEAEALEHAFDHSVAREWSEMAVFRPDLSYMPK